MRKSFLILACLCLLAVTVNAHAVEPRSDMFLRSSKAAVNESLSDAPKVTYANTRADTFCYGGHDGSGYAILGGVWDFADGTMQGWYGIDQTLNLGTTWWDRYLATDYEYPATAPMTNATAGHLWCGGEKSRAMAECWACDAGAENESYGYAGDLCQRITGPLLTLGAGDITIGMQYYTDSEGGVYDYSKVVIVCFDGANELEILTVDNLDAGIEGAPGAPINYAGQVFDFELPDGTDGVKLRFEFVSDGGWDDEDGDYCSEVGPIGLDNVVLSGAVTASYTFETTDHGFVAEHCPGIGNWVAVRDVALYTILDPCACELEDYVLAFHDDNLEHGDPSSAFNQANMAVSPIVDRTAYPPPDYNSIFARWDMYAWMPLNNGVLYRPGWFYDPWECEFTGATGWSPRVGQSVWHYVGTDPVCYSSSNSATSNTVPGTANYYRFCLEVLACCACFGIGDCTGTSNETPLFDNIEVCVTGVANAPVAAYGPAGGNFYQDAFSQSMFLDPAATGRCDSWDVGGGAEPPYILADSLAITGPAVSGATPSWEAYLWVHLPRVGPSIDTGALAAWKSRFSGDPETGFVKARMDSSETILPFANKMCSYFHENDPGYNAAFENLTDENEILPDDLFTPGTLVQYFVTTNYIGNPEFAFLQDTTGGFFLDIDFLPSMRNDTMTREIVWPCVLYVDSYNRGAENFIQPALDFFLQEVPGIGPNNDRYDENGGSSNFNASSIYRNGNNGATLPQLLGYKCIILNSGDFSEGALDETDIIGLEDWLLTSICEFNDERQGLILNGDEMPGIVQSHRPSFLFGALGAGLDCSPYRDAGCPSGSPDDTTYCVQIIDVDTPVFPTSTDIYAYGNGCPNIYTYSVMFPQGTGLGNRSWFDYDFSGPKGIVEFAQIVNEDLGFGNYRTSVEGYSYHHITSSFNGTTGQCVPDSAGIVSAAGSEIIATLNWMFDGPPGAFCTNPCTITDDVPDIGGVDVRVNRLFQNRPNPFNPRTVISFSVAQRGKVELAIYDVSGRLVRQLRNDVMDAGQQNVVWDGTDDVGHKVTSGIYWSQLKINDYMSTKKMVLLK
ncbi:MAG: FlgD immunoglobulin-like domain containing protein [bacterium]